MIDVGVGDNYRLDRTVAQTASGMQEGVCEDLLAQVGRSVDERKVFAIDRHGDARLGPTGDACVARPSQRADWARAIPLRNAAAGRRTKHNYTQFRGPD